MPFFVYLDEFHTEVGTEVFPGVAPRRRPGWKHRLPTVARALMSEIYGAWSGGNRSPPVVGSNRAYNRG